jgi:hypothetical protein
MDIREILKLEFADFNIPPGFAGGRRCSSLSYEGKRYFVHLKADGTIGKIEEIDGENITYLKPA